LGYESAFFLTRRKEEDFFLITGKGNFFHRFNINRSGAYLLIKPLFSVGFFRGTSGRMFIGIIARNSVFEFA
jgi:hypothetical protein